MKLILDEWIVREVIDTLYMARTTFLGITGLDSPQEVEKKAANETAITRRISKAIDLIQQSEQSPVPNDLEEAAEKHASSVEGDYAFSEGPDHYCSGDLEDAFVAGAKWQKEQDEKEQADLFTIVALDAAQRAKEQMLKDAVEGEVVKDISNKLAVTAKINLDGFKFGDKVCVIVLKKED